MNKNIIPILSSFILVFTSCNTEFDTKVEDIKPSSGTADFSKFIALGDSYSAGSMDGSTYISGQENSPVNILASQFKLAGGGDFKQPLWMDDIGGIKGGSGKRVLQVVNGQLVPVALNGESAFNAINGVYNNMAVPGTKSYDLINTKYNDAFFRRFSVSTTTSILNEATTNYPDATFFSLWIGGNDVLGYAVSGGTGIDQTGNTADPTTYAPNDITDPTKFEGIYKQLLDGLTKNKTVKGVVANLPSVADLPFFTTVPSLPINLPDATIDVLNNSYAAYNNGLLVAVTNKLITPEEGDRRKINFVKGQANGAVMIDTENLTDLTGNGISSWRQTTKDDLILLPASAAMRDPLVRLGTQTAMADNHVLTPQELKSITDATSKYNASIQKLAVEYGLAYVDLIPFMANLKSKSGITYSGINYTPKFVTGGTFSLDAIHPTGKGYAMIANEFIKSINKTYNSTLSSVNPNNFKGIIFP